MFRLTCATFVLITVLALTILGVRLGSGGGGTSRFSLLFTNPDGNPCQRPCLFGIRPENMGYGQASALRDAHVLSHSMRRSHGWATVIAQNPTTVNVVITYDSRATSQDRLPLFTFGEVINTLGPPTAAKYLRDSGCLVLYFAEAQIEVVNTSPTAFDSCDGTHFGPDDDLYLIMMVNPMQFQADLAVQPVKPWHGFGDPRQYASP